jgi:LTXXQ motif family protein
MSVRAISKSSRIAVALLASVAATTVATDALAARGGGGGGHGGGGGGGFHGGGGGFHGGGGGGGFHGGGGGFHGGGGGFHGFAAHGISHGFAGHAPTSGHAFAGRSSGGHTFAGHAPAARTDGVAASHNAIAAHPQSGANQLNARGQFAHNQSVHNQFVHNQLAHNQFVARNFRGLHNFNHTGFNRNAFGDPSGWNRWGGRFWGAGWNRWGYGWGGWAGPVFWPYLYGDIFSFAFWPYDYYDPFWAYGSDFLLASIFAPGPYFGADYGYAPDYSAGYAGSSNIYYGGSSATPADRQALAETDAAAAESCGGLAPGVTDLPIAQIKQTVRPTGDQLTALDDLNAAAVKARDVVKASCPSAIPLTPVARLDAAQARLEAMTQAVDIIQGPLEKFYDSLNDEQKHRFDAMGNTGGNTGASQAPAGGNLAVLCGQQSGDVTSLPVDRIQQVVQPNSKDQQDAFDALKQASHDVGEQLQASCPTQVPQTPVARLDVVKTRLQAMVDAMNAIRPKLQAFYASLSDEQKARFNTMVPPQSASSQQQRQSSEQ